MSDSPDQDDDSGVSLSNVLIAFQKTLARSQRHTAGVRRAADFVLGERTLYSIDGLDVELKVGLDMPSTSPDSLAVNFHPRDAAVSSVRFRVQSRPVELVETGVVLFRTVTPEDKGRNSERNQLSVLSVAQGKPFPSRVNIHVLPLLPTEDPVTVKKAVRKIAPPGIDEARVMHDHPKPGVITVVNVPTDNMGLCVIEPVLRSEKLILIIHGVEFNLGYLPKKHAHNFLVYASIGSSNSEIERLFPDLS